LYPRLHAPGLGPTSEAVACVAELCVAGPGAPIGGLRIRRTPARSTPAPMLSEIADRESMCFISGWARSDSYTAEDKRLLVESPTA